MAGISDGAASGASGARVVDGYVVDVVPLLRWPGNQAEVHVHDEVEDLGTTAAQAREIDGVLVAESMSDSLSVTGHVEVAWRGECRRCLEPTDGVVSVEVREVYERVPVEGETYALGTDQVDLEPMVRELVLLSLPLAPLCSEECAGPAPDVFPATLEPDDDDPVAPEDAQQSGDPRWAALDALVFDDE